MTDSALDLSAQQVRTRLLDRAEIVIADVREEALYAESHPLWAANFPLSRIELEAWRRIPRRDTTIVVYGDASASAKRAVAVFRELGYTRVGLLAGGLDGWVAAGGELFQDVNAPSKAFGELVDSVKHTPSLSAPEVLGLIESSQPPVVVDARRFDEFHTMNIPTATSVPGAELVLRIRELVPDATTRVVVNCAGRTRSIIGAQSLINAGLPNPVAALRNGTIGWTLAGQDLQHAATAAAPRSVSERHLSTARAGARGIAEKAGVSFARLAELPGLASPDRTTYRFDVRSSEEFERGHLEGFLSTPGGQLVQETDHHAPVRGARLVLVDDDGVRASMTGSWLAQMGWDTWVISAVPASALSETGPAPRVLPAPPEVEAVAAATLSGWLAATELSTAVIDVGASKSYLAGHLPGAWHTSRSQLARAVDGLPQAQRYVVTCETGLLSPFAAAELRELTAGEVVVLRGGTAAWPAVAPLESGVPRFATEPIDRYRRPYEGTDNDTAAMQAYLDWEYGLVAQLERDGTHFFHVV